MRWLVNGRVKDEEYEKNAGDVIENRYFGFNRDDGDDDDRVPFRQTYPAVHHAIASRDELHVPGEEHGPDRAEGGLRFPGS